MKTDPVRNGKKAVILLSGGLDSTLAARLLLEQGVELHAIHFTSPFCTCSRVRSDGTAAAGAGCRSQAQAIAGELGIPIRTVSKGTEYVEVIRSPRHGRGSGMNPCIDCRIFTLRKAREFMEEIGASFLVTGEVVGQRPMSQREEAFRIIERESGCRDLVLRPLSAKHFEPTLPEREGWVDREKLLHIVGRSRKEQIRLAAELALPDTPCPAGGCLLTERGFSRKVRDLLEHVEKPDMVDLNLLKVGRHFRMADGRKAIVARNESENRRLEALCRGRYAVYVADGFSGPSVSIQGGNGSSPEDLLRKIYTRYSKQGTPAPYPVREISPAGERCLRIPADEDFEEVRRGLLA